MKWSEALAKVHKPTLTNREASGLVRFGRSVFAKYGRQPQLGVSPFDWYAFALPALGWFKEGDKFKVDAAQQLAPYPTPTQLWAALDQLAAELDAQGVAFTLVQDPRGTDASFKQLANEAWTAMKAERQAHEDELKQREIPGTPGHGTSDDPWVITPVRTKSPSSSTGSGGAFLLLLLIIAASSRGRR